MLTGVTFSALLGLFSHPNDAATVSRDNTQTESANSNPSSCPRESVDTYGASDQPEIEFALDDLSLEMYAGLISQAQTQDEAEGYLNQVFDKWDYHVHIAEVPILSSNDFATRGSDVEHTPELITQNLINISSIHILESLRNIPAGLMELTRGTDVYLTMGMTGESGGYAGLYAKDENGNPLIIVGIGPADPSGEIFEHELSHNIFFRLCGDNIGYNDVELASFNPADFKYTRTEVSDDYWVGITASRYGATNTAEDIAEAFPQLFYLPLGRICINNSATEDYDLPICDKQNLLIERIAAVDPTTARYLSGI